MQIRQQVRHGNLLGLPSESMKNIQRLKIYKRRPRIKNKNHQKFNNIELILEIFIKQKEKTKMKVNMSKTSG